MSPFEPVKALHAQVLYQLHALSFETPWSRDSFSSLLALPTTVGFLNETGFVLCAVVADEAEILTICVHPDCRRRGIASLLLTKMETYLKEKHVKNFFLDVRTSNVPALGLYHKFGFREINRRSGYYETPNGLEDALVLKKEL